MTQLYPYQKEGVQLIEKFDGRVLLADEQGLGKTIQALIYLKRHPEIRPAVIVCPAAVKYVWEEQAKQHCGLLSVVCQGQTPPKRKLFHGGNIFIINYDILLYWSNYLRELHPKIVICDECHMLKSRGIQRTRAVRKLCAPIRRVSVESLSFVESRKHDRAIQEDDFVQFTDKEEQVVQGYVTSLSDGIATIKTIIPHLMGLSGTPLTNRPEELWTTLNLIWPQYFPAFTPYAWEFCLHRDAPILMHDLTEKPIYQVKPGDKVIGWAREKGGQRRLCVSKVKEVLRKKAPLQKVTLQNGDILTCTADHRWATGRSRNGDERVEYMRARTGRLGGKGKACASRVLRIFDGTKQRPKTDDYKQGYLYGAFQGDGFCSKTTYIRHSPLRNKETHGTTKCAMGVAANDKPFISRVHTYLMYFGKKFTYGRRKDGLYFVSNGTLANYRFISKTICTTRNDDWYAGFLGGIYDAEGYGQCIRQSAIANPYTYGLIEQALQHFGFKYVKRPKDIRMLGGRSTLLRFWNIANPKLRRKLIAYVMNAAGKFSSGGLESSKCAPFVKTIIPIPGVTTTYTLTTETGNYVAYGYGSKNCEPEMTPYGWKYSGAANLDVLHKRLKRIGMIRRLKRDVLQDLPTKRRIVVPLDIDNRADYDRAVSDFLNWLHSKDAAKAKRAKKAERLVQMAHLRRLAAEGKIKAVREWIDSFLEEADDKLVVGALHHSVIDALHDQYRKISVTFTGKTSAKKRRAALLEFRKDNAKRIIFGQIKAIGTGVDGLQETSSTSAVIELPWDPGTMSQFDDRIHRIGQQRNVTIYYLVARDTIEEKLCQIIQDKQDVLTRTLDGEQDLERMRIDIWDQLERELLKGTKQ